MTDTARRTANVCPRCGLRKQSFPTRRAARRMARLSPGLHLHAYRCARYFHLTSVPALVLSDLRERDAANG